jgi:protein-S-isoprenylcysteine O-methyltransferase Ste14
VPPPLKNSLYGECEKSLGPKLFLTSLHLAALCIVAWMLFGTGFEQISRWTSGTIRAGDPLRCILVFSCASVYFVRICFTGFYLMRRTFGWGEAVGVGIYIFCFQIFFGFLGGKNSQPVGGIAVVGAFLYVAGSYLNTGSEYRRQVWKQNPENKGRLYTEGLFRYAMHINYFGDEMLFTGYALITGSPWALIIPALMVLGFTMVNIPMLDRYLRGKYGAEFEAYSRRTKKFVPYVY